MQGEEGVFGFGLKPKKARKRAVTVKNLLTIKEVSQSEILLLLRLAAEMKERPHHFHRSLVGKTLAMIFTKPSTRTRVSFEAGMNQLGGSAIYLSPRDLQLGRGETIPDTARVLSGYVDAILIRTFAQSDVEEMAAFANVPVINGLTDDWHPCQILADLFTIAEVKAAEELSLKRRSSNGLADSFKKLKIAYVGDGNNVANTLVMGAAISGMEIAVATPKGYEMPESVVKDARKGWGAKVETTTDPFAAVKNADFVYTDVWASMGQEEEHDSRLKDFEGFQVNAELLQATGKPDSRALHCLPAHRGEEISAELMEAGDTLIWQQAENRLHIQKALLLALILEGAVDEI